MAPPPHPPPHPGRDQVLEGRRSQGRFSLNILDYGVFGASKYEANMFLFFIGPEVFSWVATSSKKSTFIWAFQILCKAIYLIFFLVIRQIENKEFFFLINSKFSADLLDF